MNKFKKADAMGNKLPEQIGKGLTDHWIKIEPEINELKGKLITCKVSEVLKDKWEEVGGNSNVLRALMRGYIKQGANHSLDTLTTEFCILNENLALAENKNTALINILKQVKQQLIDRGHKTDSITIMSIDAAINENSI